MTLKNRHNQKKAGMEGIHIARGSCPDSWWLGKSREEFAAAAKLRVEERQHFANVKEQRAQWAQRGIRKS